MPYIPKKQVHQIQRNENLTLISKGHQLKGLDQCFFIGKIHKDVISRINLKGIHPEAKADIVRMINAGRIYILTKDLK